MFLVSWYAPLWRLPGSTGKALATAASTFESAMRSGGNSTRWCVWMDSGCGYELIWESWTHIVGRSKWQNKGILTQSIQSFFQSFFQLCQVGAALRHPKQSLPGELCEGMASVGAPKTESTREAQSAGPICWMISMRSLTMPDEKTGRSTWAT